MWPNLCTEKGALKLREKRISNVTLLHKWVTYWVHVWDLLHLRSWASYLHQCVYVHSCMHVRVIESTVNTLSCITSFGKVYAESLKQTKCCYSLWWMRTADFSTTKKNNKAHLYDKMFHFYFRVAREEELLSQLLPFLFKLYYCFWMIITSIVNYIYGGDRVFIITVGL